jgi:hypothetical protein
MAGMLDLLIALELFVSYRISRLLKETERAGSQI